MMRVEDEPAGVAIDEEPSRGLTVRAKWLSVISPCQGVSLSALSDEARGW